MTSNEPASRSAQTLPALRYRLLSRHFEACVDLSDQDRDRYLASIESPDPAFLAQLRDLLRLHDRSIV